MAINHKHLMTLLQENFTTIVCVFREGNDVHPSVHPNSNVAADPWNNRGPTPGTSVPDMRQRPVKGYTYKAHLDDNIQVGDVVVVDSPNVGLTLVDVVAVHDIPQINLAAEYTYKWIVQRVDTTRYQETLRREKEFTELVVEAERVSQRELLLQQFKDTMPPSGPARILLEKAMTVFTDGDELPITPPDAK